MFKVEVDKKALRKTQAAIEKRKKKALLRKNIKSALRPGANIGLEEAQRLVPVKTGALKDSLAVRVYGNALIVRSTLKYAPFIEFKSKPFLRPVIKSKKDSIVLAVRDEYKKIVI